MTTREDHEMRPPTLPQLERLLVDAARRRATPRFRRPRWVLGLAAGSLIMVGGAAAAATGVIHISDGRSAAGEYSIDRRPSSSDAPSGSDTSSICLQLRYNEGGAAYGCGERPTTAKPFGLVIADALDGSRERVIYGLVSSEITRVSALGVGDLHTDAATRESSNLPGRFFSMTTANRGRIELVGYDAAGQERARIGSRARPDHSPRSHDEAVAQGDLAGFAPAIAMATSFSYGGSSITPGEAAKRGLSCTQNRKEVRCYDSLAELDADIR